MAIVSSIIASDSRQADGRRAILEQHTDQRGLVREYTYLAAAGADVVALYMTPRVAIINAELIATEIAANIASVIANGAQATTTLNYSTAAQNFAGLRLAYATMTKTDAIMAGDFLSSLTDAQLQTAFAFTAGQVTTLRANKLTPAATAAATIRAAAGA